MGLRHSYIFYWRLDFFYYGCLLIVITIFISPTMKCRTYGIVLHVLMSSCPCVCVCICERDKSKNNAWIFTKLSTQVGTLKISDEFEDGQNLSSSSNSIAGYLLILVRFSLEIYIKMLKYQLFRRQILLTSKIQVKKLIRFIK